MENTYKNKYLKYKTKYVMLKNFNQVGNGKYKGGNQKTCGCLCKECTNCEECKICKNCNCKECKNCKDCKDCK
jgi:hypothetical protein